MAEEPGMTRRDPNATPSSPLLLVCRGWPGCCPRTSYTRKNVAPKITKETGAGGDFQQRIRTATENSKTVKFLILHEQQA